VTTRPERQGQLRIAMIGTRGVPARYGGFETAIEEIGRRLVERGHEVTVYCRNPGQAQTRHLGMRLVNLPAVRRRELDTLSHSTLSVRHAVTRARPDVAVVFNAANAPLLPVLKTARIPTAVHVDGLEWRRAKWAGTGARYYRWAERAVVRRADEVIADSNGIVAHLRSVYGREATYIPYGAPIVEAADDRLTELGLTRHGFHLAVARFAPENHVREIVEGFVASSAVNPLVVVGGAPYEEAYTALVHAAAGDDRRVRFVGEVWDHELLSQLYGNALSYLHGHSVGGTNPSLLQAMGAGAPVSVHDVVFNHEVTGGHARLWTTSADVCSAVKADEGDVAAALERGAKGRGHVELAYRWDDVAAAYEDLCMALGGRR
jgi:glycosyltransferase involved in cell wall biosynthesis